MKTLIALVKDGSITEEKAASQLNIPVSDFQTLMEQEEIVTI